jgi:2-polyprenyl-6-methoxyphenol hydroxylase-like FAD-dependent oxidoreductase
LARRTYDSVPQFANLQSEMTPSPFDVLIVGAGPVGLFLGCRLAQLGISFKILEKRMERFQHSRSIGIHPPSLERLEPLGVIDDILQRGVRVERGHGFANTTYLGMLNFASCRKPYNFVISLPQFETEAMLEKRLCDLVPGALLRGVEVINVQQNDEGVVVEARGTENRKLKIGKLENWNQQSPTTSFSAKYIVACDGKDSIIRQLAGIPFQGADYPDTYLMGDFADNTKFGADAALYLTDEGLIESFPLVNGSRRWVAKTNGRVTQPSVEGLAEIIQKRIQHTLPIETNSMLSSFGVQRYLADTFVKNHVLLAGDAAHVVSPIGGQGMNLGWLDAWDAGDALANILLKNIDATEQLKMYDSSRKKAAQVAIRRAAFNMRMGRKTRFVFAKYAFARLLLREPFASMMANIFTMRGL